MGLKRKIYSYSFLILFVAFLATPTVVVLIERSADIGFVFNFAEEENQGTDKSGKKLELDIHKNHLLALAALKSQRVFFEHYNKNFEPLYFELISPPPEA